MFISKGMLIFNGVFLLCCGITFLVLAQWFLVIATILVTVYWIMDITNLTYRGE